MKVHIREDQDGEDRARCECGGWEGPPADFARHIGAEADGTPTVKRLDIFGQVHDTYQTESELNGWRERQGRMI